MMLDLANQTALITGSGQGIGFAAARALGEAGAQVIVNARTKARTDAAVDQLHALGIAATGVAADLCDAAGCDTLVEAAPRVDILVNNVGIFGPQDFFETPDAEWERFFEINVMSGVRLARAYLPVMMAEGRGRVIFISSESAFNIPDDMIHYGMTKTANVAIARGLAKRAAGTGVTVNSVLPGPTLTEGVEAMIREAGLVGADEPLEDAAARFVMENRSSSIIQRMATPEEVANMILYVASPLSSATTGAALRVDGGVVDGLA